MLTRFALPCAPGKIKIFTDKITSSCDFSQNKKNFRLKLKSKSIFNMFSRCQLNFLCTMKTNSDCLSLVEKNAKFYSYLLHFCLCFNELTGAPFTTSNRCWSHHSYPRSSGNDEQGFLRQGLSCELQATSTTHPHAT